MENRQKPTYPVGGASWQTFFKFFSISQFRVNEHCKQIQYQPKVWKRARVRDRTLWRLAFFLGDPKNQIFVGSRWNFFWPCGQKFQTNSKKVTLPTSPPLPYMVLYFLFWRYIGENVGFYSVLFWKKNKNSTHYSLCESGLTVSAWHLVLF
jgi:hypothetical protein